MQLESLGGGGICKEFHCTPLLSISGGGDGSLLFIEAAPVLCMTRDPCDPKESLWVSTTEPHITKWVRHVRSHYNKRMGTEKNINQHNTTSLKVSLQYTCKIEYSRVKTQ